MFDKIMTDLFYRTTVVFNAVKRAGPNEDNIYLLINSSKLCRTHILVSPDECQLPSIIKTIGKNLRVANSCVQ
jgi:hypothetical protein